VFKNVNISQLFDVLLIDIDRDNQWTGNHGNNSAPGKPVGPDNTTIAPAQLAAAAYYNRRRQLRRAQHFGVLDRPGLPHNRRSGE